MEPSRCLRCSLVPGAGDVPTTVCECLRSVASLSAAGRLSLCELCECVEITESAAPPLALAAIIGDVKS